MGLGGSIWWHENQKYVWSIALQVSTMISTIAHYHIGPMYLRAVYSCLPDYADRFCKQTEDVDLVRSVVRTGSPNYIDIDSLSTYIVSLVLLRSSLFPLHPSPSNFYQHKNHTRPTNISSTS